MTSKIKLNVKGKNIERFIKRLKSNNIDLLKIEYIKYNEINIIIYKKDYEKLLELKTIYDVNIKDIYGIIKVREVINIYKYLIIFIAIGIMLLIFLSNVIFNVEVIHNDKDLRNLILNELENYDIKKYKLKKNYDEIQAIKNDILTKYQDKIEWLEIEEQGTSYIIRVEPRIIPNNEVSYEKQNVVAGKSAVIKKIIAKSGEVVKELNTYVNKGDIIISGNIPFDDKLQSFFLVYLDLLNLSIEDNTKPRVKTVNFVNKSSMYYIMNTRTKKILMKTPRIEDAKKVCNENPCCVVKTAKGEIIHRSTFSRVTIPNNKPKMVNNVMRKSTTMNDLSRNLVKIKLK